MTQTLLEKQTGNPELYCKYQAIPPLLPCDTFVTGAAL